MRETNIEIKDLVRYKNTSKHTGGRVRSHQYIKQQLQYKQGSMYN